MVITLTFSRDFASRALPKREGKTSFLPEGVRIMMYITDVHSIVRNKI